MRQRGRVTKGRDTMSVMGGVQVMVLRRGFSGADQLRPMSRKVKGGHMGQREMVTKGRGTMSGVQVTVLPKAAEAFMSC